MDGGDDIAVVVTVVTRCNAWTSGNVVMAYVRYINAALHATLSATNLIRDAFFHPLGALALFPLSLSLSTLFSFSPALLFFPYTLAYIIKWTEILLMTCRILDVRKN